MWKFKREMPLMWVLKEFTDSGSEYIVGCIGAEVKDEGTMVTIGPIAVRPDFQVICRSNERSTFHLNEK